MADYGHELLFGTFITPSNERPENTVALAELTERVGLDFATFQDHPYQPSFLDTWTLLSWVAARTERLRVASNVLNLPLRNPAVVARSAASLDLLSGGRFELGLGAGAFWDAVAAMGGPKRSPGESVKALDEAVDVIRGLWDVSQRRGVHVDGEHYRVAGAKRGPEPAHEISIWLGAYKPRMLRLTGRKADGWLPSMPYIDLADVPAANETIDEAAEAAGRDPREIRRLFNIQGVFAASNNGFLQGPPEQWVEELLPLVLEHGFSAFFVAGDDPNTIERFAGEVAPALREEVARERERAGTPTAERFRSPKALALRTEGIDYDRVPAELQAEAVEPGDRKYDRVRSTYIYRGSPGLVLRPGNAEEVAKALTFARAQGKPIAVRSGGHGISGRATNDGGIVIDLGRLDGVEVIDPERAMIRLGPGARWGEVAEGLAPHGLAMSSGDYGDVGVGGLATAGGLGFLARRHGLTIDRVRAAEVVLADGTIARADAESDPDLLWAVRGAGAHIGIVTSLELESYELGDVVFSIMAFDADAEMLERWGAAVEAAPRELTSFLTVAAQGGRPLAQLYTVYAGDDAAAATAALEPLLEIGTLRGQRAHLVPYPAIVPAHRAVHVGAGGLAVRSGLFEHVDSEVANGLVGLVEARTASMVQIRAVGGAVNDLAPDETAYAHRTQNFAINAAGFDETTLDADWDGGIGARSTGLYASFNTDPRPERLAEAYPGETLTRLRRLKARYDPDGVFGQNLRIEPARDEAPVGA